MSIDRWDPQRDGSLSEAALRRKVDAIVSGRFRITMAGRSVILGAGDAIEVPRGTEHRAEVLGPDPVVREP